MQRQTPLDTSLRAFSSGGSRGIVEEVGPDRDDVADGTYMQELKIRMMKDEERERVEHAQNYGFTSHVLKADKVEDEEDEEAMAKAAAAEHFVNFIGGNRSFPVVQNVDDRRVRLRCLEEGEVCVYDDQQQKVHLQRDRIYTRSQYKIEQRVIIDDPKKNGHGSHKVALRDQTQDKSVRLSTIVMDDEEIVIERTKLKEEEIDTGEEDDIDTGEEEEIDTGDEEEEEGEENREDQEGEWQSNEEEEEDDPEELIQTCSQIKLGERQLSLTTHRDNGEPHLVISLDEDTSQIVLQTLDEGRPRFELTMDRDGVTQETPEQPQENKPGLIMEMDDQFRRILLMTTRDERPQLVIELDGPNDKITLKTNGKTEQIFDNDNATITFRVERDFKVTAGRDVIISAQREIQLLSPKITLGQAVEIDGDDVSVEGNQITLDAQNISVAADGTTKLGGRDADKPVAMLGSVTSSGDRIVGAVSQKVTAK